jgi:hypothetical protein
MIIAPGSSRQHHSVRMESRGCHGGLPCLVEKTGVGFDAREFLAFEIEDFYGVVTRSTIVPRCQPKVSGLGEKRGLTQQRREDARAYSPS